MNSLEMPMSMEFDQVLPAYMAAKKNMSNPTKNKVNTYCNNSKYVDLQQLLDAVIDHLDEHDLAVLQPIVHIEGKEYLLTRIMHSSGQWIGSASILDPERNGIQAYGSEITYMRRYHLMALCGLAPADDDGNQAQQATEERQRQRSYKSKKKKEESGEATVDWGKRVHDLEKALQGFPVLRDQLAKHLNKTKGAGGEGFEKISSKPELYDAFMRRAATAQAEGKDIEIPVQKEDASVA